MRKPAIIVAVCLVLLAVDRLTKELARIYLEPSGGDEAVRVLEGLLYLRWSTNAAGFFGFLDGLPETLRPWVFLCGSLGFMALLAHLLKGASLRRAGEVQSLSLILAGVLGNGLDRVFYGYVIDCVFITWFGSAVRASANLADIAIAFGLAWFLVVTWFAPRVHRRRHEAA